MNKEKLIFLNTFLQKLAVVGFVITSGSFIITLLGWDFFIPLAAKLFRVSPSDVSKMYLYSLSAIKLCFFITPLVLSIALSWSLKSLKD